MRVREYITELEQLAKEYGDDTMIVNTTLSDEHFEESLVPRFIDITKLTTYHLEVNSANAELIEKVIVV